MKNYRQLRLVQQEAPVERSFRRLFQDLWPELNSQKVCRDKLRQMHSLHYVVGMQDSSRPEISDFCIERYSERGDVVLDPFLGGGTTALQSNIKGRVAWGCDVDPFRLAVAGAKLSPVGLDEVVLRLNQINLTRPVALSGYSQRFAPFFHPDTYRELVNFRACVASVPDRINRFLQLLIVSRLHGHTPSFLSAYTFPHIAISPERQRAINNRRHQSPVYRALAPRVIKRAAQVLRDGFSSEFYQVNSENRLVNCDARNLKFAARNSVDLVVTAPPLPMQALATGRTQVDDCWLQHWFCGVDPSTIHEQALSTSSAVIWGSFIRQALNEMLRVLKPGAYAVLDVGVQGGGEFKAYDEMIFSETSRLTVPGKQFVVDAILEHKRQLKQEPASGTISGDNAKSKRTASQPSSLANTRLVVLRVRPKG